MPTTHAAAAAIPKTAAHSLMDNGVVAFGRRDDKLRSVAFDFPDDIGATNSTLQSKFGQRSLLPAQEALIVSRFLQDGQTQRNRDLAGIGARSDVFALPSSQVKEGMDVSPVRFRWAGCSSRS
jgi:hypothetical protein